MNKKIVIIVVLVIIFIMISKKAKANHSLTDEVNNKPPNPINQNIEQQIISALEKIVNEYGIDIAKKVERIYRKETRHFDSVQFKNTFTPGMEKHKDSFPFGWTSMAKFWSDNNITLGFFTMPENKTGIRKTFIKVPNVYIGMKGLATYLQKYPAGRWFSTDPVKMNQYESEMNQIIPKITNKLINV